MTSPIPFCDTHPGEVINRAKIDVGTSASFERVKADTPKHAQTELRFISLMVVNELQLFRLTLCLPLWHSAKHVR